MDPFCYLCFAFVMFSHICYCSLVVSCWEIAGLLALLFMMFSGVLVTFPCGALGQVWYLIILIPDLCLLTYFYEQRKEQ